MSRSPRLYSMFVSKGSIWRRPKIICISEELTDAQHQLSVSGWGWHGNRVLVDCSDDSDNNIWYSSKAFAHASYCYLLPFFKNSKHWKWRWFTKCHCHESSAVPLLNTSVFLHNPSISKTMAYYDMRVIVICRWRIYALEHGGVVPLKLGLAPNEKNKNIQPATECLRLYKIWKKKLRLLLSWRCSGNYTVAGPINKRENIVLETETK